MKNTNSSITCLLLFVFVLLSTSEIVINAQTLSKKEGEYTYEYIPNDPLKTRIYTLENGLKIYLSVNKDEPRIQTAIAVRVGSKNDPRETTGLAHYLEHMLFKGTDKFGTTNWEEEEKLIKEIADLYEKHAVATDPKEKQKIYEQIDKVSNKAAEYTVPNEYDKMIGSLGAKGTNAYTSTDETVYVNDIPTNELEKWLKLESERFSKLVLRLFHTELEAVYEEFNMSQDRDGYKVYKKLFENLFPNHPYNILTIGLGEHLKNPSLEAIEAFFEQYYVPNNMAICLAGDFNPSTTIELIDKYFGKMKKKEVPKISFKTEEPLKEPVKLKVIGNETESVTIAYRFKGAGSRDALMLKLMDGILQNGQAGLMDLNLIQKQKVLSARTYQYSMNDYSIHVLEGTAREGQSLEQVKNLLLGQMRLVQKGEFPEWLIDAVIKEYKLSLIQQYESNRGRIRPLVEAFISGRKWESIVKEISELDKITKASIIQFAKQKHGDGYVVVNKLKGEDTTVFKVVKPAITPIGLNREAQSDFYKEFEQMEGTRLKPVFLDYNKEILSTKLKKSGIPLHYIKNKNNKLFRLYYILDMGTNHDKKLALAIKYLPYLGTDKYSAKQLKEEFYKLGLSFDVFAGEDRTYVYLEGLDESYQEGLALFEHILANVKPDKEALKNMVEGILKERVDNKSNRNVIMWQGLYNYGIYGKNSSFTNILSKEELEAITPEQLTTIIKGLTDYKHKVFYYGTQDVKSLQKSLKKYHKVPKSLKDYPEPAKYVQQETKENKVLFVNYDMVQSIIVMLSKDGNFDKALIPQASVFGEYFGGGMSSIVFQEIRESRGLAYSAFASYRTPSKATDANYVLGFLMVQADKMADAIPAMKGLLDSLPKADKQFAAAKTAVMKKIETERITKYRKFFNYLQAKDKGLDYDIRKDVYETAGNISLEQMEQFFTDHVKNKNYTFLVMGNKKALDMKYLESLGEVTELTLEELFNY